MHVYQVLGVEGETFGVWVELIGYLQSSYECNYHHNSKKCYSLFSTKKERGKRL